MKPLILVNPNLILLSVCIAMLVLSGCTKDPITSPDSCQFLDNSTLKSSNGLTSDEKASLMFMVEEEKLAHDVYTKMYEFYGLVIFDKIIQSESDHVAAVSFLIEKHELVNPITGNPPGVFQNEELQQLYIDLVALGSISTMDAIEAGVTIEEKDLQDIQYYLVSIVESKDLEQVYSNLMEGSKNHLEAYLSHLGLPTVSN